jgi:hypothetical protein
MHPLRQDALAAPERQGIRQPGCAFSLRTDSITLSRIIVVSRQVGRSALTQADQKR